VFFDTVRVEVGEGLAASIVGRARAQKINVRQLGEQSVCVALDETVGDADVRDLLTVFAGGNDVNVIMAALGGGAGGGNQAAFIDQQVQNFSTDFATLIDGLRDRTGTLGRIVALNLPNLAGLPYLAAAGLPQRQAAQRAAVAMATTVVNPLTAQGVAVVDLMCDPRSYVPSNYFSDGFHPNDAGYAFIASEVVRAITLMSYPAPQSSCAPMTLVR